MSQDEFNVYLARSDIGDKICFIRLKYSWEEEVEILGCIDVCDVTVPLFAGGDSSAIF